jgi:hypothetical protein
VLASNLPSYDFGNHEHPLQNKQVFPFRDCAFSQLKASHSLRICLQPGSINGNDKRIFFSQTEKAGFSSFSIFARLTVRMSASLTADDVLFGFNMTCIELPHHQAAWLSWVAGNRNATQNPCPAANNARAGASLK